MIGILDMPVQGGRVILCEHEHPVYPRIQAIGNGNVHQPVFARNGYGRLRATGSEWIQSCTRAPTKYNS